MTNCPQPDPTWPYYALWQQVTAAHAALEKVMKYMSSEDCENPNLTTDNALDHIINEAHVAIIQAGESFPVLRKEPPKEEMN